MRSASRTQICQPSTAAAVTMQVVSQLDSPEAGNGSDGSGSSPHSSAQAAELQLAAAWQVLLLCCDLPWLPALICTGVHLVCTLSVSVFVHPAVSQLQQAVSGCQMSPCFSNSFMP